MERRSGVRDRLAAGREKARGDPFGLSTQAEMLEALAEAVWAHYKETGTGEAAADYLSMLEDAEASMSDEVARVFRERHAERRALVELPPLRVDQARLKRLFASLQPYNPPPYNPQTKSVWIEPKEPVRVGSEGRVRENVGVRG